MQMSFRQLALLAAAFVVTPSIYTISAAQEKLSAEEMKEIQSIGTIVAEFQRMAFDTKLADDLELTPDQKRKVLIIVQTHQDEIYCTGL